MKQLKCEMCGGTDLIKQDGVFVCQSCGCKYSVEEAKKMMVEGVVQVEGTVKIDNTDKAETYKEMAINAYAAGNTAEAYEYFLKVLEINPTDFQSVFYKGMCQGWQTTLARPRVGEAIAAYFQAEPYIPDEISKSIKESFIDDLIRLLSAWFQLSQQNYFDVDDWYSSNIDIFWDYLGVAGEVIEHLDGFKETVISSNSAMLINAFGELYCNVCEAYCSNIVKWVDYSRESATFPGLQARDKQPILRKYDDVIFEVRKYTPNFRRPESTYGVIDRMDPPRSIGPHNTQRSETNFQRCLEADRAINQKLEKYKNDILKKEREEREKKYWEAHPEDKITYDALKVEYDKCVRETNNMQGMKNSKEALVKKFEDAINALNQKISQANQIIHTQQKKIFGKAKAQAIIAETQAEIARYQTEIADININLNSSKAALADAVNKFTVASQNLNEAKSAYDSFVRKCGL